MSVYFATPLQTHTAPPEDTRPVVYECEECEEPIRDGDGYYVVGNKRYCDNCVERNHHYAEHEEYCLEEDF